MKKRGHRDVRREGQKGFIVSHEGFDSGCGRSVWVKGGIWGKICVEAWGLLGRGWSGLGWGGGGRLDKLGSCFLLVLRFLAETSRGGMKIRYPGSRVGGGCWGCPIKLTCLKTRGGSPDRGFV